MLNFLPHKHKTVIKLLLTKCSKTKKTKKHSELHALQA